MNKSAELIINQYIKPDEPVIIGISGGPDSVYLLLQALKKTSNVIVAHINHKTRGRANTLDQKFVEGLAKNHNLTFELHTVEHRVSGNQEQYYRRERYAFFEKLREKYKAQWILVAHHLNDNIETVLFNLTKGSFLDGLTGMEAVNHRRHILRPLIFTTKDEILTHLHKTKTPYRKDKTNDDTDYSRNRIRHNVIPELKSINENLEQTFAGNIVNLQELKEYFDDVTATWIDRNHHKNYLSLAEFKKIHPILQKNVIYQLYAHIYGEGKKINQKHLEQILKIIHQSASNRKKEFGKTHYLSIQKKDGQKVISITRKKGEAEGKYA